MMKERKNIEHGTAHKVAHFHRCDYLLTHEGCSIIEWF